MRPRRRFGMILNGKGRPVLQPDPFDGLIIQVDMGDLDILRLPDSLRIHAKAMILRSDLATAGDQVFHRVIEPAMPVMHFEGGNIIGQSQQLVAQTNAKQGFFLF